MGVDAQLLIRRMAPSYQTILTRTRFYEPNKGVCGYRVNYVSETLYQMQKRDLRSCTTGHENIALGYTIGIILSGSFLFKVYP